MSRYINTTDQINYWGRQAGEKQGADPQRNDLFLVDFTLAQSGVTRAIPVKLDLLKILPHYVKSINLPESRLKPDTVRRESVPYPMPSWDDPLDPAKITFLLDTHEQDDYSAVVNFLDAWMALTRAGRGDRYRNYNSNHGHLLLNSDFRVDFQFNIFIYLVRGLNASDVPANIYKGMRAHSIWVLTHAWLGGYKLSDFTYSESGLTTVEATFYADSIEYQSTSKIIGEASPSNNPYRVAGWSGFSYF